MARLCKRRCSSLTLPPFPLGFQVGAGTADVSWSPGPGGSQGLRYQVDACRVPELLHAASTVPMQASAAVVATGGAAAVAKAAVDRRHGGTAKSGEVQKQHLKVQRRRQALAGKYSRRAAELPPMKRVYLGPKCSCRLSNLIPDAAYVLQVRAISTSAAKATSIVPRVEVAPPTHDETTRVIHAQESSAVRASGAWPLGRVKAAATAVARWRRKAAKAGDRSLTRGVSKKGKPLHNHDLLGRHGIVAQQQKQQQQQAAIDRERVAGDGAMVVPRSSSGEERLPVRLVPDDTNSNSNDNGASSGGGDSGLRLSTGDPLSDIRKQERAALGRATALLVTPPLRR